ncbi:TFIIB-type zinc ribbon-containing protein [Candidatus Saccharibacteria bacterium]|nr:TFIIB-type zinc ribbon-containing protein [Candidatus Saccharibacteria bacterium]
MTNKVTKNGANRCPHCGATDISLSEKTGKLRCGFCRAEFAGSLNNAQGGIEALKGDIVGDGAGDIVPGEDVILTLKCPACGAEVVINTEEVTSARCHWCRHVLSINEKMKNGAVPDMVLPFKLPKAEAQGKIDEFVGKRQFYAHPTFRKEYTAENIMGVYLPYMVVDANAHATLTGEAEHLLRSYTVGSNNARTRYYDADVYDVSRDFDLLVDDLTIEASADKLNQNTLINTNNVISSVMPFDTENCEDWNPGYLRGYASEKRDTNIDALKPIVELQVGDMARYQARSTMDFYNRGVKWTSEMLEIKGRKWRAAYLPVWLYSYLEVKNDKKMLHYVAVNARTGETMGSVPINKVRLRLVSAIVEVIGIFLGVRWILYWLGMDMDDDNPFWLGFAGFTPGFIYYWVITNRYRNMSARHRHEQNTKCETKNMKTTDTKRETRKRLRSSRIEGENGNSVKGALSSKSNYEMLGEKLAKGLGVDQMLDLKKNK